MTLTGGGAGVNLGRGLGHFQVGSYRYKSLIEGLKALLSPKPKTLNPKP